MITLSALLLTALAGTAHAQEYTVRLEGPGLSAGTIGVTYEATENLWWFACQNHNPIYNPSPNALKTASYELKREGNALVASVPAELGGYCGFGTPDGLTASIKIEVNGLSVNSQILVLPAPVPGVTGDAATTPIRCERAGDDVAGKFYRCAAPTYAFTNGAISLSVEAN